MHPKRWTNEIAEIEERGLRRRLRYRAAAQIDLSTNDYLGLASHPKVVEAAIHATREYGVGATASRLLGGNLRVHHELEREIADFKSAEAALVFSSGYAANVGLLSTICEGEDAIFCDRLNHASLIDGARMSKAKLYIYPHRDVEALEEKLKRNGESRHRWIITDGVFSMDGTLAPLPELIELGREYHASVIIDDAHGTAVLGPEGRGSLAHFGLGTHNVVQMGTLSKALGSQGGFVAGSQLLIDLLVQKARSFIYSTGLAVPAAAAATTAIRVARDSRSLRARLQEHCDGLRIELRRQGWEVIGSAPAPMLGVVIPDIERMFAVADHLESSGIRVAAVRPPTVPADSSRLRIAPSAALSDEEIGRVVTAFADVLD